MSANNAKIVRRFYTDLIAQGRLDVAGDLLAPGSSITMSARPDPASTGSRPG